MADMSIFWRLLSGAGFASLPHSFPWLTYGDLFRVLRPYVLQPYAGISDSVGSYCDSARTSFGSSVKDTCPCASRHGLAGGVPVLSYHEDRDKGCSPVDEKPAADRAFTDAATSCCDLRICTCTTIAALPAGSRSAFRLRRIAGDPGARYTGQLL